jgi:hypothetical protein
MVQRDGSCGGHSHVRKMTGSNIEEGRIGLQSEGAGIEVRKVMVEPLGPQ